MNISDISYEDLQCLLNNGIQPEQYLEQLERYKVGFSHINLHSPATVENGGILRLSAEKEDYYEKCDWVWWYLDDEEIEEYEERSNKL